MKLLVVLSIKDYQQEVSKILNDAGVSLFSVVDITGYKQRKFNAGWFGVDNGKTNSIALFSFTSNTVSKTALELIDQCNRETRNPFPVKGFVLDVEQFSGITL
ncbi:MAG: hypothetical protein AB2L24_27110 [Mangrovibacterium sp.]|jgi:hypothetical protein